MLTYHRTSLLDSQAQTLVNTVNTVGVMGKGLAAEFRRSHPGMYEQYRKICAAGLLEVGKLWLWKGGDQWVLNFPTKKHWRYPSKIDYIEIGLQKFVSEYEKKGIREIAFPRLGCGNGGLDWENVQPIMHKYLSALPIRVYIHDFATNVRAPEHATYRSHVTSLTFHDFLCDVRESIKLNSGKFFTIANHSPFTADLRPDNSLVIRGNKTVAHIDELDLYDLWVILQKGPVPASKIVGTAQDARYNLIALIGSLSYVRVVKIANVEADEGSLAIEINKSKIQSGLIAA